MTTEGRADESGGATGKGRRRAPGAHERQRDPERTKARILDAAAAEFSDKGFAGARVSAIAARAGVNQQLIAYYFDGKAGLYREMGRQWRQVEAAMVPDSLDFAETIRRYVHASIAPPFRSGRLLAWDGLADDGADNDAEEAKARDAQLRAEVEQIRRRQSIGELDDRLDPAALMLIAISAANALAVYPQLARGLFGVDDSSSDLVEHYAEQLVALLCGPGAEEARDE